VGCWFGLRTLQTVHYRITLKVEFHLRLKSNSLLTVWSTLSLSQQSTVSPNYSQSINKNLGPYAGGTIIPSIHRFIVLYWRLSDLYSELHTFCWKINRRSQFLPHCCTIVQCNSILDGLGSTLNSEFKIRAFDILIYQFSNLFSLSPWSFLMMVFSQINGTQE
jgi:hypothetical protein